MATWSSYRAPLNSTPDLEYQALTDGEDIYWVSASGTTQSIIDYDPVGDTETVIFDEQTSPFSGQFWAYTIFKDELYIVVNSTGIGPSVYKYDGTPNDWTLVDTLRANMTAGTFALLYSNDNYIVAIHVDFNETYDTVGHHSTDGTNWSVSSFETLPINDQGGLSIQPLKSLKMFGGRPIITDFCTTNTGAPDRDCTNINLMKFENGAWSDLISGVSDASESAYIISPISNQCWTNEASPVTSYQAEYTNDDFDTFDTPNESIRPILTDGYRKQFGIASGTVSSEIYIWENLISSNWTSLDTLSDGIDIFSSGGPSIVTLDNLDAYLVFFNFDNAQYEMWKRDEPLPPVGGEFYFGQGVLQYKHELPFKATLPGAMAVQQSQGIVVTGADRPTADMSAYSAHPYDAAIVADENIPTGTSVSAIRWI